MTRAWVPHPRHPLASPPAPFTETPIQVMRRCLLVWEASLGITTGSAPRDRALIREMRTALRDWEHQDNQRND